MVTLASNFSSSSKYLRGNNAGNEGILSELEASFRIPFSEAEAYLKSFAPAAPVDIAIDTAMDLREQVKSRLYAYNFSVDMAFFAVAIVMGACIVAMNNVIPVETVTAFSQLSAMLEKMDSMYALGAQWAALDVGQQ